MENICSACAKKVGYFYEPLILNDGEFVICEKCRKILKEPLDLIRNAKSIDEVKLLNNSLTEKLKNDGVSDIILVIIDKFSENFIFENSKELEIKEYELKLEKQLQYEQEIIKSVTNQEINLHIVTTV